METVVDAAEMGEPGRGSVTVSRLGLTTNAEFHGEAVTCRADNGAGAAAHDAVTLSIKHKPAFKQIKDSPAALVEGERATLNLTASANPNDVDYVWSVIRKGQDVEEHLPSTGRVRAVAGVVYFDTVLKSDEGTYFVAAENAEGKTEAEVPLEVHFPARIVGISPELMVGPGEPAHLECAAEGAPNAQMRWERAGYDMEGRTQTTAGSPSTSSSQQAILLTVVNATAADSGAFACVADNGVGPPARNLSILLVRRKSLNPRQNESITSRKALSITFFPLFECKGIRQPARAPAAAAAAPAAAGGRFFFLSQSPPPPFHFWFSGCGPRASERARGLAGPMLGG